MRVLQMKTELIIKSVPSNCFVVSERVMSKSVFIYSQKLIVTHQQIIEEFRSRYPSSPSREVVFVKCINVEVESWIQLLLQFLNFSIIEIFKRVMIREDLARCGCSEGMIRRDRIEWECVGSVVTVGNFNYSKIKNWKVEKLN